MSATEWVACVALYLKIGIVVALGFVVYVGRIDAAARGAYAFRLLILPGAVLLWPLVLARAAGLARAEGAP